MSSILRSKIIQLNKEEYVENMTSQTCQIKQRKLNLEDLEHESKCEREKSLSISNSLRPYGLKLTRFLHPWDSPDKNTGVSCHFLLRGIFLIQGLNLGLLHCRQILYHLSHWETPKCEGDTHKSSGKHGLHS